MPDALWATFGDAASLAGAVRALRERGHVGVEAYSPFAVAEVSAAQPLLAHVGPMWLRGMPLPWVALGAGVLGGAAGYAIQWFANAWAYPQNAGGRPANAIPAFVFNTFESIVLVGCVGVFLALLLLLGLPRLFEPRETIDGFTDATDDRFGLLITESEPWLAPEATEQLLRDMGAADVRRVQIP